MNSNLYEQARSYQGKQLYHAAIELYQQLLDGRLSKHDQADIWDAMGMCYIGLGLPEMASQCFERAESFASGKRVYQYRTHTALSYSYQGDYDKAQRILTQCLEPTAHLSKSESARIHANLAYVMSNGEFYRDGLEHTKKALEFYSDDIPLERRKSLYINMGYFYLELSLFKQAKEYLEEAVLIPTEPILPAITDLSRVYVGMGQTSKSLHYAEQALNHVWTAVMNFERTEIAQLCRLTAILAYHMGELHLALRLMEKAQMFFGQLGIWGAWIEARDTFEEWQSGSTPPLSYTPSANTLTRLNQFLLLLDAIQAQERIGTKILPLIDMRVLYGKVIAEDLGIPERDIEDMVYAARFADYGLCALEPEVVENPRRSTAAWEQYQQHPLISMDMLDYARISETSKRIILEHHEKYDGTGFPHGKKGDSITILSQVLAVADHYAVVVSSGGAHTEALKAIQRLSGTTYSPVVVHSLERLFTLS